MSFSSISLPSFPSKTNLKVDNIPVMSIWPENFIFYHKTCFPRKALVLFFIL